MNNKDYFYYDGMKVYNGNSGLDVVYVNKSLDETTIKKLLVSAKTWQSKIGKKAIELLIKLNFYNI